MPNRSGRDVDRLRLRVRRSPRREARWRRDLDLHLCGRLRSDLNRRWRQRSGRRRLVRGRGAVARRRRDARRIDGLRQWSDRCRHKRGDRRHGDRRGSNRRRRRDDRTWDGHRHRRVELRRPLRRDEPSRRAGRAWRLRHRRRRCLLVRGGRAQLVLARARGLLLLAFAAPRRGRVLVRSGFGFGLRRRRSGGLERAGAGGSTGRAPAQARRALADATRAAAAIERLARRRPWRPLGAGGSYVRRDVDGHQRVPGPPVPRRPPGRESGPRRRAIPPRTRHRQPG